VDEENASGEIGWENHIDSGPWVSKGNPTGYLDSDIEFFFDQMGHDWRVRRMRMISAGEKEKVARSLLSYTVHFVDPELVETVEDMKEFDPIVRILVRKEV